MSMVGIAAIIALFAALASATGDVIRQRSAHEITDQEVGHLKLFGMSLRDAKWWTGGACAVLNYSLQAIALVWASVETYSDSTARWGFCHSWLTAH